MCRQHDWFVANNDVPALTKVAPVINIQAHMQKHSHSNEYVFATVQCLQLCNVVMYF
jgi:hypothetical protein